MHYHSIFFLCGFQGLGESARWRLAFLHIWLAAMPFLALSAVKASALLEQKSATRTHLIFKMRKLQNEEGGRRYQVTN